VIVKNSAPDGVIVSPPARESKIDQPSVVVYIQHHFLFPRNLFPVVMVLLGADVLLLYS
jgi:hypothetical protein